MNSRFQFPNQEKKEDASTITSNNSEQKKQDSSQNIKNNKKDGIVEKQVPDQIFSNEKEKEIENNDNFVQNMMDYDQYSSSQYSKYSNPKKYHYYPSINPKNQTNFFGGMEQLDSYYPRGFFNHPDNYEPMSEYGNQFQIMGQFYPKTQNQIKNYQFSYNTGGHYSKFQMYNTRMHNLELERDEYDNLKGNNQNKKRKQGIKQTNKKKYTYFNDGLTNINTNNINQVNLPPQNYKTSHGNQEGAGGSGINLNISFSSLDELLKEISKNGITPTQYIKTQKGSREVQKLLYKISPNDISTLIHHLAPTMTELMTDKYGNYFCQKLIQNCSPEQRIEILKSVKNNFSEISCNSFGTHSLQVLVEIANMENEQELLSICIEKNLVSLSCDQRGTHIIQKFLSSCSDEKYQKKIHSIIIDNFSSLVNNPHGVCVLIRLLKYSNCIREKSKLIELVIKNSLEIIQNPFGNYVVQTLFNEHFENEKENCMKILNVINENFFSLSMQKFSSNVVENSLRLNSKEVLKKNLLNVIVSGKIGSMLKNTYGNFVIEKLILKLTKEEKREIKKIIETKGKDKTNTIVLGLLSE